MFQICLTNALIGQACAGWFAAEERSTKGGHCLSTALPSTRTSSPPALFAVVAGRGFLRSL